MKRAPKTMAMIVGFVGAFFYSSADARPIIGRIDFGGIVTYDTTSLATATRVNLWQPNSQGPSNFSVVLQDSMDFSSISPGTSAAMASAPWIFDSGTPAFPTPGAALNSLWSVGGFTFDLTSATVVRQDSTFLNVTGTGFISSTNTSLDRTPGIWSFTSSKSNGADSTNFGFQATSQAVPEPSTIMLLGTGFGLVALRLVRRKMTNTFLLPKPAVCRRIGKMKRKRLAVLLLIALIAATISPLAQARPIQGNINFNGVVTLGDQTGANTTDLSLATRVNVWNDSWVSGVTGDFSSITPGFTTKAAMAAPWIWNSGTPGTPAPGPGLNSLWSVGGFTFDLTSSTVSSQSSSFLDVEGIGTIRSTNSNLDPTPGTWSFTISSGSQNGTFSFQAEAAVPEPSSIALVVVGAIGAAATTTLRRRLKRA
jgi:hypothetical protein